MNKIRAQKSISTVAFLSVAFAAISITSVSVPSIPRHGVYKPFAVPIIALGIAGGLLIILPDFPKIRLLGTTGSVILLGLIPLQWGTFFGIRDTWIHIAWINSGDYVFDNIYPAFHSFVDIVATVTGLNLFTWVNFIPLYTALLAVLLVTAVSKRLSKNGLQFGSFAALVFAPIVFMDHVERPFIFIPAAVFTTILLVLVPMKPWMKRMFLLLLIPMIILFHLTGFIAFSLLIAGCLVVALFSPHYRSVESWDSRIGSARMFASPWILGTCIVFFVIHIFYVTDFGIGLTVDAISTLFGELAPGVESGSASGGGGDGGGGDRDIPLVIRAMNHVLEIIVRTAMVLLTAALSISGILLAKRKDPNRMVTIGSLLAGGGLISLFIFIDLTDIGAWGVQRVVPITPIILFVGAVIGLWEIYNRNRQVAILTGCIVFGIGLLVLFPAPLLDTGGLASTPSDVERTDWLVENSKQPVIDSQNTYVIAEAKYGPDTAKRLANGKRGDYERNLRSETYQWKAKVPEGGGLIVIHEVNRLHLQDIGDSKGLPEFERSQNHIYSGGNSDIYWVAPD